MDRLVIESEEDWAKFRAIVRTSLLAEIDAFALQKRQRTRKPGYSNWCAMMTRCYNANSSHYKDYGGRGIKVFSRWHKFKNFISYLGSPPPGASLERIDVNKGYSPKNCRWATNTEQARNKRNSRRITVYGETKTLQEWANQTGMCHSTLWARLKYMTPEAAVSTPINEPKRGRRRG